MNDCMIFKVHLLLDGERVSHAGDIFCMHRHTHTLPVEVNNEKERIENAIWVLAFYQKPGCKNA